MYMDYLLQSRESQFEPPNLTEATAAKPGSIEKLQVMAQRYRAGQPLHHPRDAKCFDHRGGFRRAVLEIALGLGFALCQVVAVARGVDQVLQLHCGVFGPGP